MHSKLRAILLLTYMTPSFLIAQTPAQKSENAPTAESIVAGNLILPKPLRASDRLEFPRIPAGFRWSILSTEPQGIVGNDGSIKRPGEDVIVAVKLRLENESNPGDAAEVTLSVPIDKPHVGASMSEEAVRGARARYERQKYGLFVHMCPD